MTIPVTDSCDRFPVTTFFYFPVTETGDRFLYDDRYSRPRLMTEVLDRYMRLRPIPVTDPDDRDRCPPPENRRPRPKSATDAQDQVGH